jgi:NAD(P)H-dependent FMN reductase
MIRVAIIAGSTRPGRKSLDVARWVHEHAAARDDVQADVVDLADFRLDRLDEPAPAALNADYRHAHTRRWSEVIASFDAYIIVTPEYNHSMPGALKTALDFLFDEWNDKPVGFVGYGLHGGVRAIEHLRHVAAELKLADVRTQVTLSLFNDFEDMAKFAPQPHHAATLQRMLDELAAWGEALKSLRQRNGQPKAAA